MEPRAIAEAMPFATAVGVEFEGATPEEAVARLEWSPERCTAGGVMHGGALTTLADSVGAVCAFLNLPEGATTATIESSSHFLRPVTGGTVRAVGRPRHVGSGVIVVEVELWDDSKRLVALTVQAQAVRRAPK